MILSGLTLAGATDNTGNAIENWMDARKDDIRVISQSRVTLASQKEHFKEYLKIFENEHQGVYREFYMLDPSGNITFSDLDRSGNEGRKRYFH